MLLQGVSSPEKTRSDQNSGFERVYQACENCRRKKQRCVLGDPSNPKPPCQNCRRANLTCALPERKRKGRPPKKRLRNHGIGQTDVFAARVSTNAGSPNNQRLDGTSQPSWQTSMSSFDPVVGSEDSASVRAPSSASSQNKIPPEHNDQQAASRSLATFPLRNTSDAIRLLDQADVRPGDRTKQTRNDEDQQSGNQADFFDNGPTLPKFFLLEEGYIGEATLIQLFKFYIGSVHPVMPLLPYERIPVVTADILSMGSQEPHFMSAILVVTASLTGNQALHELLWRRVQTLFANVAMKGMNASIEVIEGLILLSEYPPETACGTKLDYEDRMCWMTVGSAVRLGYLLGLEKLGMEEEEVDEKYVPNRHRAKVAWTYCYCLDRQISIRLGKVFWHRSESSEFPFVLLKPFCLLRRLPRFDLRGPGMTYHHLHGNPSEDFPEMREIAGVQDDYAAYLQCLIQITQVLSNAHDLLYPSQSRSVALAKAEHYYKHIDDFAETLSAFRTRWQSKTWRTYPINECVWVSFHHLRLYIYSFALQAHMQRVSNGSLGNGALNYFPTGLMGSSDSRFIAEAINASARKADVLRLAIGRLQPSGALACLPTRFFLFFSHAGVFLLKAAVIVPLPSSQKRAILRLIRALTKCMSAVSADPKHPAIRCSRALDSLVCRIYSDQELQTPAHTRPTSPKTTIDSITTHASAPDIDLASVENDLPTFLGSRESFFVAEQSFQDLATDIDALFGVSPNAPDYVPQQNMPAPSLPCDPFSLLFNGDEKEFWNLLTLGWDIAPREEFSI